MDLVSCIGEDLDKPEMIMAEILNGKKGGSAIQRSKEVEEMLAQLLTQAIMKH